VSVNALADSKEFILEQEQSVSLC